MNFKRTTNSTENLEDFIDGAETQKDTKKQKRDVFIQVILSRELADKIKKRYPKISLTKWVEQALMTEILHIKDELLSFIYQKAEWHNIGIKKFIKFKMGLTEAPQSNKTNEEEKNRAIGIRTNKNNRQIIQNNAKNLGMSIRAYSEIKIKASYELEDIFTFEELMQFKAEAMNYDLELDEYIAMRIKG
ncbi:hypothetical protein [Campylobacter corcagiensis]|uniref:Uncharacterized protein n=1 Tax=Campylobacter corcagiensis TaxID=1448857 RepID=A0A7M1LF42_9BACT|nr:hypothetical protein [Campylobacter corcagiensis]QKF65173.1 hypothetical protein CCORG_1330 [Campylobacter corcagiensis]QOQ86684.1 hypothetical protein IMC76_05505 [Campylobacter corcagiensis]